MIPTTRNTTESNPWFTCLKPDKNAALRLFCFPYAGGGALIYRTWPPSLPEGVEVYAAQLPGRGTRLRENAYTKLSSLVDAVATELTRYLDKPFAFFGHSMGALIGFELAHKLRIDLGVEPVHLFISGTWAPQSRETNRRTYNLPDDELIEELRRLNGTPKELLEHPELVQLMLPVLRADFEVCQTHIYPPRRPLTCPITVFGGLQDNEVTSQRLEGWREHTAGPFSLEMLSGDHFFLHASEKTLLRRVSQELTSSLLSGEIRHHQGGIYSM
jgi:medium-chain acyl-[acyl-carrier-protein] hydrolase